MAKITLNDVTNLANENSAVANINANSRSIETAFDNTISRDGTTPNQMLSTLDMNSNRVINLPGPVGLDEPLRLQELADFTGTGVINAIPPGGTTGQVLSKLSSTSYDATWQNPADIAAGTNIVLTGTSPVTISTSLTPSFTTISIDGNTFTSSAGTAVLTFPTVTDTMVGRGSTDTLRNKTIDTAGPNTIKINGNTLSASAGTATLTFPNVTDTVVGRGSTDILVNKTIDTAAPNTIKINGNTLAASAGTATLTFPNVTDTMVGRGSTDTLINKSISGSTNTLSNIASASLSNTTVTAASYGSATQSSTFTVNAQGQLTTAANVTITPAVGSITGLGTGVGTALAIAVGSAGGPVVLNGAGGTPSSITLTNASGTASSLTAGNVTTNANLTGDVTSVGNATTLTNAPVIAKVLTGYTSGAGTISATDSILSAIQKLNGNDATNANLTGDVTSVGNATTLAAGNAGNLNSGTLLAARMPAHTGDVTSSAGSIALTLVAGNAGNLNSGTLLAARMPALTGDVTTSAGAVATTIGATKVTSAMLNADVFSTAHSWGGVQTFTAPVLGAASASSISITGGSFAAGTMYSTAAGGLITVGKTGSTYDFQYLTPGGVGFLAVPTGTQDVTLLGGALGTTLITVGSLPAANAGRKGYVYTVTDASAPSWGTALSGGGAVVCLALCTGAAWVAA